MLKIESKSFVALPSEQQQKVLFLLEPAKGVEGKRVDTPSQHPGGGSGYPNTLNPGAPPPCRRPQFQRTSHRSLRVISSQNQNKRHSVELIFRSPAFHLTTTAPGITASLPGRLI